MLRFVRKLYLDACDFDGKGFTSDLFLCKEKPHRVVIVSVIVDSDATLTVSLYLAALVVEQDTPTQAARGIIKDVSRGDMV